MPYSSEHLLYTFNGGLPGGEIWTIGLRTGASSITDPATLDGYAADADGFFKSSLWTTGTLRFYNTPQVSYIGCTVRHVSAAGITTSVANATTGTVAGAGSSQTAPNQGTVVASLLTSRAGRSYRGRVYLPTLAPEWVITTGRISSAMCSALAVGVATLISDLNGITTITPPSGPFPISIQSKTSGAAPPPVTSVRVGDVLDTQRRRRDKLIENYTPVEIT